MDPSMYQTEAEAVASSNGIPPLLFSNLVAVESSWNPYAVSPAGAQGLTQLMPATADQLGVDPWNPSENLSGGATWLAQLYQQYGNWTAALSAYNSGSPNSAAGLVYASNVLNGVNAAGQQVGTPVILPSSQPSSDISNPVAWATNALQELWNGDPFGVGMVQGSPAGDLATSAANAAGIPNVSQAGIAKVATAGLVIAATIVLGLYLVGKSTYEVADRYRRAA